MYQQSSGYAGSYASTQKEGLSQKEVEVQAFISAASSLNKVRENWDSEKDTLPDILEKNKMLWSVIASAMQEEDCPQPREIRNNIIQLATFIFKRTLDLLGDPRKEGLDILININMNIARGLSGNGSD